MNIYYVEFRAADFAPVKAFYSQVFGWKFEDWGDEYMAFSNAGIEGGFYKSPDKAPRGGALIVLLSEDTSVTEQAVLAAGGEIIERIEFPGGRRFHFLDPAGNELAVAMNLPLEN